MKFFWKLAAVTLLAALLATSAGAACLMPAALHAPQAMQGCRHRTPAQPQPAGQPVDHRCCVSSHPSALPASIFSPVPSIQISFAHEPVALFSSSGDISYATANPSPGTPPGALILRI